MALKWIGKYGMECGQWNGVWTVVDSGMGCGQWDGM